MYPMLPTRHIRLSKGSSVITDLVGNRQMM